MQLKSGCWCNLKILNILRIPNPTVLIHQPLSRVRLQRLEIPCKMVTYRGKKRIYQFTSQVQVLEWCPQICLTPVWLHSQASFPQELRKWCPRLPYTPLIAPERKPLFPGSSRKTTAIFTDWVIGSHAHPWTNHCGQEKENSGWPDLVLHPPLEPGRWV